MSASDPVSQLELRRRGDDELLALVHAARADTDPTARETARRAWNELIERDVDRVRALVSVWRLPGRDVRVAPQDRDDAIQYAFYRLLNMLGNFKGSVLPQYRAAMATCVDFACRDFCRGEVRHEMGLGGSLDDQLANEGGEGIGRFDDVVGEQSARTQADQEAGREGLDALGHALKALPSESMRSVVSLTIEGRPSGDIAERLGLSVANVDQLRSRGLRRLRPALEEPADV